MYKWLTLIVALLALGLFTAVSEAGTIRLQGKFTRAQIAKACASVEGGGGAPFGTNTNSGSFGCLVTTGPNEGNQVNCTANGNCTGTCPRCGRRDVRSPRTVSGVLGSATARR
jgi:hypothetical protein